MFAPAYIAWYKAYQDMGIEQQEIDSNIWNMNAQMLTIAPKSILHRVGKMYFMSFRKKAEKHIQRQETTGIHPYDWKIIYRNIDTNCFEIDILTCGIQRLIVNGRLKKGSLTESKQVAAYLRNKPILLAKIGFVCYIQINLFNKLKKEIT